MAVVTQKRTRLTDGAGYHLNDDSNSGGKKLEHDVISCTHCETLMFVQDWKKERKQGGGTVCRKCQAPVCGPCGERMILFGCEPFLEKIDRIIEENYRKEQNRKVLGI